MPLFVCFFFVCPAKEIIDRDIVEISEFNEYLGGDIYISAFIVAVYPLAAMKDSRNLCLCHIGILAQVANPSVYHDVLLWHYKQIYICIFVIIIIDYFDKTY